MGQVQRVLMLSTRKALNTSFRPLRVTLRSLLYNHHELDSVCYPNSWRLWSDEGLIMCSGARQCWKSLGIDEQCALTEKAGKLRTNLGI